jgi:VIT1/CCC1 family predicted Fe2+/Mn2+ transporter
MLDKKIKKSLIETKERKEKKLIEETLIKNRLSMIIENVKSVEDFNNLSDDKKLKLSVKFLQEMSFLEKNGLLLEIDFSSILKSLFGGAFGNVTQTLVEPFIEKILGGVGLNQGYIRNFLVSYLTSRPSDIIKSFSDCKLMTKLVAGGIVESIVKTIQEEKGFSAPGYDLIRNTMADVIRNIEFVGGLEKGLENTICSLVGKFTDNAEKVAEKIKPSVT